MSCTQPVMTGCEAWYCVRTQPKHEHIAAANLRSRMGLEVFHPRFRIERATRRGVVKSIEPLFPCYIFARCELASAAASVRYVSGVSSLVSFGGVIPVVPDETIDELKTCFESEEPLAVERRLLPGTEVTVSSGAFLGSKGVVVQMLPARKRVQILLDFLGRATVTEVDLNSLQVENRSTADLLPRLAIAPRKSARAAA